MRQDDAWRTAGEGMRDGNNTMHKSSARNTHRMATTRRNVFIETISTYLELPMRPPAMYSPSIPTTTLARLRYSIRPVFVYLTRGRRRGHALMMTSTLQDSQQTLVGEKQKSIEHGVPQDWRHPTFEMLSLREWTQSLACVRPIILIVWIRCTLCYPASYSQAAESDISSVVFAENKTSRYQATSHWSSICSRLPDSRHMTAGRRGRHSFVGSSSPLFWRECARGRDYLRSNNLKRGSSTQSPGV
ncbi:hypothetical protein SCHPADRAFT_263682 [Schizopora paradoxa]|uniref:Uncharacterized protein n=1 Tax=Schizopora paradoxa TaxID=27342 RepID=A0A0H2RUG3_9AGAM|nr:hypothetical protein SCHPADRAFT_263682 [Schizopora paradoxa]